MGTDSGRWGQAQNPLGSCPFGKAAWNLNSRRETFFGRNDIAFHKLVFYAWIAQGDRKTVLIDAGPPPDERNFNALVEACQGVDRRSTMRRLRQLESVFTEASISPESVDCVLITQPITYCTGGLIECWFPHARVYMSRAGFLEFLLENPGHPPRHAYFTESTWTFIRRLLVEDRLCLTDEPIEVSQDIYFETTGGHHPGSAAVRLKTSRGLVGILETAFLKENIDTEHPIGVAENVALCRQAIRRYKRNCDIVLAAHDNTIMERYPGGVIA